MLVTLSAGDFVSCTMWNIAESGLSSKYGGLPVSSSMTVQPRDQTSQEGELAPILSSMVSGGSQYGDPATSGSLPASLAGSAAAPRSARLLRLAARLRALGPCIPADEAPTPAEALALAAIPVLTPLD